MESLNHYWGAFRDSRFGAGVLHLAHFIGFAVRRFLTERLASAAASLTYSTLLALVPLLVIAFAILSGFPAFDEVKDRMQAVFFSAVVPEAGAAIADYLERFTGNASNLTTVGIIALAFTALLLLSTIEDTLNRIWHVERPRPILYRFLIFWAILTLGPLLIGGSFTLTSDLAAFAGRTELEILGGTADVGGIQEIWIVSTLVSLAINIFGFTAIFALVPARRVKIRHAVIGASFAAISFELLSWGFNAFVTSGSSYETIYGAVAAVPVFLLWIYTSWTLIILGAVIAASIPEWQRARSAVPTAHLLPSDRLEIAVALLAKLHRQAQQGGMLDEEVLSDAVPLEARDEIFDALHREGYVVQTEDGSVSLARDLHGMTVYDLAADLGLPLGLRPEREHDLPPAAAERLRSETGTAREMLGRLHTSEKDILGEPVARIIGGPDPRGGADVERLPRRLSPRKRSD